MSVTVTLALGANVGDPVDQLEVAVRELRRLLTIEGASSVYITEPVGVREQPDFFNLVIVGTTTLTVYALHAGTQEIERSLGRLREVRNGPRSIDIDIIAYGELVLTSPGLTLPHPRFRERAFVLAPLAELDPYWRDPLTGATSKDLLNDLREPSAVRRWGPLPQLSLE